MDGAEHIVEIVFRREYGKIIAILTNRFGPSHIERIEDAVQDALLKATQLWAFGPLPDHPTSWLLRVAQNRLIDILRSDRKLAFREVPQFRDEANRMNDIELRDVISDSQLKMIFACCHPALSAEYQLILSLKLIGGFGNKEIARVLLKKEATVAKSFTRAKKQLRSRIDTLDIPVELGLQSRLTNVLRVIYLLFSEGYAPRSGSLPIKMEICREAIRLALILSENKYCDHANLHALIALMCFHTSRFDARVDGNGELVDLEHQDRSNYDKKLIALGMNHLERGSRAVSSPSNYHLEAAVSYYHCIAGSFEETQWGNILHLYDLQLQRIYSPVVLLNRVVPYFKVHGAAKALEEIYRFEQSPHFTETSLYYAIKAELLFRENNPDAAGSAMRCAIALTENDLEKKHLQKKLQVMEP